MGDQPSPEVSDLLARADAAYRRADLDEAGELYGQVIALKEDLAIAHSRLGAIMAQRGDLEGAEAALRRALELDPHLPSALSNLGNVFFTRGQYAEALKHYQAAADREPDNPIFYQNLHAAYRKLGQLDKAVAALKKSRRLEQAAYRQEARTQLQGVRRRMGCGGAGMLMLGLIALLVALGVATGCSGPRQLGTVKIASSTPLTGSQASMGTEISRGVELAIADAQPALAQLGVTVEYAAQDDQAHPAIGAEVARGLVADQAVIGVVGTVSADVAQAQLDIFEPAQLVMVSPVNTAPRLSEREDGTRAYQVFHRVVARDDAQGPAGARFAVGQAGAGQIYVLQDQTLAGEALAEAFAAEARAQGASVTEVAGVNPRSPDFSAPLDEALAAQPDLILLCRDVQFGGPPVPAGPRERLRGEVHGGQRPGRPDPGQGRRRLCQRYLLFGRNRARRARNRNRPPPRPSL